MKRYLLSVAAALAVVLAAAGGAVAKGRPTPSVPAQRPGHGTSLVPSLAPHLHAWLHVLRVFPRNPEPSHKAAPPRRKRARRQPQPPHGRLTTLSIYEHKAKPWILSAQGCSAARRHENGVVVLDFGKPAFEKGGYGTILFSGRFAKNRRITTAMVGYARGYVHCLPSGSNAFIQLARGTSNYHPAVPSAYAAGVRWARETNQLGLALRRHGLAEHVAAAAADDAEPAWDRHFSRTRGFFHGFRAAVHGHTLYDYGSLDGGVGAVWSARQAWYVAGGLRHTQALPEIYNAAMAREWAELAQIARGRYHRDVRFAGVMTQGSSHCGCGLRPLAAHRALAHALGAQGIGRVALPRGGTNIIG
ncbi:MAG: hypothetical protein ACJ75G_02285 [Gaiellaceae bacterium]